MALPPLFFVDRAARGRLRLTGRDRQSFLQGMVTNDVAALQPGQGCYAFHLDATGHVLSDLRVICTEDALLLDVEPGAASALAQSLEKHLIMERCRIEDVSEAEAQFLVGGTGIGHALASYGFAEATSWEEGRNVRIALDMTGESSACLAATRLLTVPAFDLYAPAAAASALRDVFTSAGAVEVSEADLEPYRIEAGIPRFGADMDSRVLAPETGQKARGISYKKGCYVGQEIVARIDARGHTNRGLVGFTLSEVVPAGSPVVAEGREVGRVTSSALSPSTAVAIGLGYIRNEHTAPGTPVTVAGKPATVAALPFVAPAPEGQAA